jgi:diaminopimelate decarboxylase
MNIDNFQEVERFQEILLKKNVKEIPKIGIRVNPQVKFFG